MSDNKFYAIYQGIVTNIKDPDKRGRIKCKIPRVLGSDVESAWCDPVVPVAYDNGGDFCIPSLKETVWISFIEGDSNRPVYLGGWWSKNKTPLAETYDNISDIRVISYGDCILTFKDGIININVSGGNSELKIENNKVTINGDVIVTGNMTLTGNVAITGNLSTTGTISANGKISTNNKISAASDIDSNGNITATGEVHGSNIT